MPDFLNGLDNDILSSLIAQLQNLWTHSSTALDGNSLPLVETALAIEEKLTASGKPLKDHEEVFGHARGIDMVYDMVVRTTDITESDWFNLHKAVQTLVIYNLEIVAEMDAIEVGARETDNALSKHYEMLAISV